MDIVTEQEQFNLDNDTDPNIKYTERYPQKIYTQHKPKKSKKLAKDDLFQVIAQKQFPFKSKYDIIRKANYYGIPIHQTKNQFDIYPQTNTLEPHDYQLKPKQNLKDHTSHPTTIHGKLTKNSQ
ncbi:MAG: hypothetical protein EZS28_016321 [Streblomastix strix]|uniref:Uncharacterized protein n=1 Tax=Streblomastix strix TaxID=222440 RepID=A0A5J4VZP8_9EUKA|nr:MAG: hypothetical protein EZS28_016321 [Streblomastix strix]